MENKKITENVSIEFHSIFRDIIRNIWVVVCAALIGLMLLFIVQHKVYTPQYTSKATLVVNSKIGNTAASTNITVSSEMAGVFTNIFVQPSMKSRAAEYAGENGFNASVSASVLSDTNILELSVTSSSPERSYRLLCAILAVYPEISDNIFTNAVIDIIKLPSMAKSPSNRMGDTKKLIISYGLAFAVFVIIVFLSIFRDTVKDKKAFEKKIDAKLIGAIPHEEKRRGIRKARKALLINESVYVSLRFSESFHKISAKLEYFNHRYGDKVFAITSVAENEGKSTVASNVAISLASKGYRVLLLDFDSKKPALYKVFETGKNENSEFFDLLSGKTSPEDFSFLRFKKTSLFLAVNTRSYGGYQKYIDNGTARKIIDSLKENVDYIIVDTAPISVDSSVTNLVKIVDKTLLVVRTDVVYSSSINDSILTIKEVGGNFAGCLLNDVYSEFSFFGQSGFDESGYYSKRYGRYGKYGKYGRYGKYNKYNRYSRYNKYMTPDTIYTDDSSDENIEAPEFGGNGGEL